MNKKTIAAIATGNVNAAIALIRVSGSSAINIVCKIFSQNILNAKHRTIFYGFIKHNEKVIDEVLVSVFKAPNSYTGEDIVEISCHGSNFVKSEILKLLIDNGASMAEPGEFTKRAFLNGKLDLSQAEAVADLIASETALQHHFAIEQMKGGIARKLSRLREDLINFTALIELELDFAEEDVEFANRKKLQALIAEIKEEVNQLIKSFEYGNAIKDGVITVIAGKPNAGKSTLLNLLVDEERAIVTEIEGTTRDALEEPVTIEGIKFRLVDTAGLRKTQNKIEVLGIAKTKDYISKAKVLLFLFDLANTTVKEVVQTINSINRTDLIVVLCQTHTDLYHSKFNREFNEIGNELHEHSFSQMGLPLKGNEVNESIKKLKLTLVEGITDLHDTETTTVITNVRHIHYLKLAYQALTDVERGLQTGLSGDLLSIHLKDALNHLGNITGKVDVDRDILGTIFITFCIGK